MRCDELIAQYREAIVVELDSFLAVKERELGRVNGWGADCCARLRSFVGKGKVLRGCLVVLGFWLFDKTVSSDVIKAAAAMELIHSSLLIHDDIMDRDVVRRGQRTMFAQYEEKVGGRDARHIGESLGMCVGDIGFFLAFELLSSLDSKEREKVILLVAKEVAACGVAQMQDVILGASSKATAEEVLQVYLFKTAIYSFSLPLMIGALLAEQRESVLQSLESFGEQVGVAFQIRDDELGLFGNEAEIGKPVGSDVREGKKTLFWVFLFECVLKEEREWLESLVGSKNVSGDSVEKIGVLLVKYGIVERVEKIIGEKREMIERLVNDFSVGTEGKEMLMDVWRLAVERRA